jgi:FAD reductase [NAD(P)H]
MKLLGISGTIIGTKTLVVVNEVLEGVIKNHPEVEVELIDLKQFNLPFCDGRDPYTYTGDAKILLDKISESDCFIIGTPIIQASIPGTLKNMFDLLPAIIFRNKVMGFVATGGTYQHSLVLEHQLKPIASYFKAYIEPNHVYLQKDHFNNHNEIIDEEMRDRLQRLADGIVFMTQQLGPLPVKLR